MSRKKLIAGNWKMNCLLSDGVALSKGIASSVKEQGKFSCDFLICPPFTLLHSVKKTLRGSKISLGGQDCHYADKGAHTGDISAPMLKDLGCSHVLLGHSERRTDHKESSVLVHKKAVSAHNHGLITVVCIGETEAERDQGKTIEVCRAQILGSVPSDSTAKNTVIAYEPVWAIGTGKTPTSSDVQEVHFAIRQVLSEKLGKSVANKMRILYGGSVKPSNASELLSLPDVDGALIGGASLKVEDFLGVATKVL